MEKIPKNLRTNNLEKHETCKKCFASYKKRCYCKNIWVFAPKVRKTFNFLNLTRN